MQKLIENLREQMYIDAWNNHKDYFRQNKIKKENFIEYIGQLESGDTVDNLIYIQGFLRALEELKFDLQRSDIRQGKNEI